MDNLTNIFLILISFVIGFIICLILGIKSYILIAIIVLGLYALMTWYYKKKYDNLTHISKINNNSHVDNILPMATSTMLAGGNIITTSSISSIPDYHIRKTEEGNRFATEKALQTTNIFAHQLPLPVNTKIADSMQDISSKLKPNQNNNVSPLMTGGNSVNTGIIIDKNMEKTIDRPPLDGLPPSELMSRLNYLYYATANPMKKINYNDYKTHADKYLDEDGTKLSTNDLKLQTYSAGFYPQLTKDQIDATDCLNYGSGPGSCFQSKQLFFNKDKNFNILDKGVNLDNANLVVREDFSMPMLLDTKERAYDNQILFVNAPHGNLDFPLDKVSNEHVKLEDPSSSLCHNCKLAVCKDDYCGLQNQLFM